VAVALLVAPGLAAAQRIARSSAPFKVQIGVDGGGAPVYESCGELNLYKTASGKEWRLEDTCNQLIDVMVPTITPTPTPGGGGTITPTPTPRATASGDCPSGFMSKVSNTQWTLTNVILQEDQDYVYCVDLPANTRPFVEVKTVNKGNTSCGELELTAISPHGAEYFSFGSQPGTVGLHVTGRWRVHLHLNWGCNRYDVNVTF
jgi:hypothetical protein